MCESRLLIFIFLCHCGCHCGSFFVKNCMHTQYFATVNHVLVLTITLFGIFMKSALGMLVVGLV